MDNAIANISITWSGVAAAAAIPIALAVGYWLDSRAKGKAFSRITLTSALLLLAWAFLLSRAYDWLRTSLVTFAGISLAFWLQSKVTDYLEHKKCRSFLSLMCDELSGNLNLLGQLMQEYHFFEIVNLDPVSNWQAILARQEALARQVTSLRSQVYGSFIASGLLYKLPNDDAANQLEWAYGRINSLKAVSEIAIAGTELKIELAKVGGLPSPSSASSGMANVAKHLNSVKIDIAWAHHNTNVALSNLKDYLRREYGVLYSQVPDDPDALSEREAAFLRSPSFLQVAVSTPPGQPANAVGPAGSTSQIKDSI